MISRIALLSTSFFAGAVILGYEILMVYILTPYFGSSHVVWTNVIATVIFSLAIGYKYGGIIADRYPYYRYLYVLILLGCSLFWLAYVCSTALSVYVIHLFKLFSVSFHWSMFFSSLVTSMILFCLPMILLGCCTPYIIRLLLKSMTQVGEISGLVYGVSTIGSLVGIIITSLVLLPLFGLKATVTLLTISLIFIATITWGVLTVR